MKVKRPNNSCCTTTTTTDSSSGGTVTLPDGIIILKGNWNGASNAFPPSAGIQKGWAYTNTANTTTLLGPDGGIIPAGVMIVATVTNPGASDWKIINAY